MFYALPQSTRLSQTHIDKLKTIKTSTSSDKKSKFLSTMAGVAVTACLIGLINATPNNTTVLETSHQETKRIESVAEHIYHDEVQQYKIANWIHNTYKAPLHFSTEIVRELVQRSTLSGLDPYLILAVAAVESNFDPSAISNRGAQGIIQVKANVHGSVKGLTIGAQIEKGLEVFNDIKYRFKPVDDVDLLQMYNGHRNDSTKKYSNKVLQLRDMFLQIANSEFGIPENIEPSAIVTPVSLEHSSHVEELSI